MDYLFEYALYSPYFVTIGLGKSRRDVSPLELVAVDDLPHEVDPGYCCEKMRALCSEIDGFFYNTPNVEEFEQMRRSAYYIGLCRQRNEHMCDTKGENSHG